MKDAICKAFCDMVTARKVPCGWAISVPFLRADSDPILLYLISGDAGWYVEDDGTQVPVLEASGVNLASGARGDAFQALLTEYHAAFDDDARVIRSRIVSEGQAASEAIRFMALLVRLQDLLLLTPRNVKSTFRDDAIAAIHVKFDHVAEVDESAPVSDKAGEFAADVVIRATGKSPLAIYLGTSEEKALMALVLKMETEKYSQQPCRVALLVERSKTNPIREPTLALAQSRLDGLYSFRGTEGDAMNALQRVLDMPASIH